MKFNKYLICALFLVLICCIGAASAAEADDVVAADDAIDEEVTEAVDVSDEVVDDSLGVSEEPALSDGENNGSESNDGFLEVYVGTNDNDGDGSPENPFSTLILARNKIAETNTTNAIINIYDGTYNVPKQQFTFGTDNLIINGLGKNVILAPGDNDVGGSFALTTVSSNFTMNNIILDLASGTTKKISSEAKLFQPVSGKVNAKITNCTFLGNQYTKLPRCKDFNTSYIGCIFKDFTSDYLIYSSISESSNFIYFENCIFSNLNVTRISSDVAKNKINVSFNGIWIGQNTLPTYTQNTVSYGYQTVDIFTYLPKNTADVFYTIPVKYAVFTASENYLGSNQYEIVGKLTWNGTDSSEGMENFPPMTVTLTSTTGEIQNATLVNGTFKAIYTSESSEHNVTAKLDLEESNLTFANVALNLNAPSINYGENQNIVINLSKPVTGIVTVTVNGKNYPKTIDNSDSIIVPIDDVLTVGTHDVNVTFLDEENHIHGFNTTTITISTVKEYTFDIGAISNVKVGDTKQLVITLPNDATGNVTVYLGTSNFTATVNGNTTTINITGFVAGQNTITVTYAGNDKYEPNTKNITVSAVQETKITAPNVSTTYNVAKDLVITLTANGEVLSNKTVNVVVGSINKTLTTNASGQVSIDISSLTPDTYTANIAFAGDELYNKSSTTAKVTVKEEIKTNITIPEITAGKETTTTITLPKNATGNITVIVDGNETGVENLTNGSATVTIPKLSAGKHNVTISYSGDDNYAGFAQTSSVEVKEPAKPTPKPVTVKKTATKITAKKKTFKAKTKVKKYTITLKAGKKAVKKVQVILKIGKKTYKAKTNSKGKATFKIKKLTKKGKYNAKITFKGNKLYKASSKKVKITVKK